MGAEQAREQQDGDPGPGCIIMRRVAVLRPGADPGIHKIAQVAGDRVGQAVEIGTSAPKAVIEYAGRHLLGAEAQERPEADAS